MQKMYVGIVAALCVIPAVFAEEEKTVGPKIALEFSQQLDGEYVNGRTSTATGDLFSTNAQYSKTELKDTASWDLNMGWSASVGLKDSLELRNDVGTASGTDGLTATRFRNRFTPSLSVSKKLVPAFNVALALEYRLASDLRDDKTISNTYSPTEQRVGVTPTFSGKVSMVDYSVAQSISCYLDSNGDANGYDDSFLELDGTYGLGTSFKLSDAATLKLNLSDRLLYQQTSDYESTLADYADLIENWATLKVSVVNGGFAPSAGLLYTTLNVKKGYNAANFYGGFLGLDMTRGSYSLSGRYDIGRNVDYETATSTAGEDRLESHLAVALKLKF